MGHGNCQRACVTQITGANDQVQTIDKVKAIKLVDQLYAEDRTGITKQAGSPLMLRVTLEPGVVNAFNFGVIVQITRQLMGIIAGPALGGTWVAQRAMVVELAPKEKFGEYMGFSKLSGKISSSLGPLLWSAVFILYEVIATAAFGENNYYLYKAYGYAMLVVGLIMLVGLVIIGFVKPSKKLIIEGKSLEEQEVVEQ